MSFKLPGATGQHSHGTRGRCVKGCRCARCRAANTAAYHVREALSKELAADLPRSSYGICTGVDAGSQSQNGGADVEAVDAGGSAVIVQTKQYAGNVGVAVVREMIGVRETREDRPRVIIFALNGFTKGAMDLAASSGIQLRSIRREVLKR